MEAITAGDGTTHVSSADDRELYAGIVGAGCYVCKTGNQLKCTMQTANKAIIGTGAGFMYGTGFRNSSAEEVTIKSGTQAQRRNDIICVHFATDSAGNETAELAVLEGKSTTAAAATDPDIPAGNLLDGATEAWMPLWRIPLDGITVGEPVALFDILVPAAEVWDSVSQKKVLYKTNNGANGWYVFQYGNVMVAGCEWVGVTGTTWKRTTCPFTIPEGLRPSRNIIAATCVAGHLPECLWVGADGKISVQDVEAISSGGHYGNVSWVAGC